MSGWFALKRGMHDHPLFHRQPLRVAAWAWMVATAAYQDTRQSAGGKIIPVKRGQLLTSYRQMSEATGVGIQVLRTLVDQLGVEHAINIDTNMGRLLITICNYDKYQNPAKPANTVSNTPATRGQHTKETKEQKITLEASASNGDEAPSTIEVSVSSSAVWNAGKPFLTSRGVSDPGAVIGRWLKTHAPLEVLAAIEAAQKSATQDPIPYITEALKGKFHGKPSASADRLNAFIAGARDPSGMDRGEGGHPSQPLLAGR
jgi:hypothetical protein